MSKASRSKFSDKVKPETRNLKPLAKALHKIHGPDSFLTSSHEDFGLHHPPQRFRQRDGAPHQLIWKFIPNLALREGRVHFLK